MFEAPHWLMVLASIIAGPFYALFLLLWALDTLVRALIWLLTYNRAREEREADEQRARWERERQQARRS